MRRACTAKNAMLDVVKGEGVVTQLVGMAPPEAGHPQSRPERRARRNERACRQGVVEV